MKKKNIIWILLVLIVVIFVIDAFLFFKSKLSLEKEENYSENLSYKCTKERAYNSIASMDQVYTFDYIDKTIKNGKREIIVIYNTYEDYKNYDMDASFADKNKPNHIINDDDIQTKTYIWYGEFTDSMDNLEDYIKMLNGMGYTCKS